jgi:hypothetical protein
MEEALRLKLLAAPALAALVQAIAWVERPQARTKVIVLQAISPGRTYTFKGSGGTLIPRVQTDIWAPSLVEVWAIEKQLIPAMETAGTVGGWTIGPGFLESDRDMDPEMIGDAKLYRRSLDWFVISRPAA